MGATDLQLGDGMTAEQKRVIDTAVTLIARSVDEHDVEPQCYWALREAVQKLLVSEHVQSTGTDGEA
jgi:hypothetical protein